MQESKETIGQRLKKIRLSRQISIEKAAEATRIRVQYIQALEADNYSAMSSAAQGRGFLGLYAGFLGLDLDTAMTELREGGAENTPSEPPVPEVVTTTPVPPETPSTPISDAKPNPRPFWARLLRRSAPESSEQAEPTPEVASKVPEEPAAEPESELVRGKKPAAKKKVKKKSLEVIRTEVETPAAVLQTESPPELEVTQPHNVASDADEARPGVLARILSGMGNHFSKPGQPEGQEVAVVESTEELEDPSNPRIVVSLPAESARVKSSGELFAELGAKLLERREALNLTREEIERHIHLRSHYLQALEQGDFDGLPSTVQTRGMLSNYAAFLDLDVDTLLLNFADVLQVQHRERHPLPPGARGRPAPSAPSSLPPLRGFIVADLMAIGLVLLLLAFSVWGVQYVIQRGAEAQATAPAMIDILLEPSGIAPAGISVPTSGLLDLDNLTATLQPLETPAGLPTIPEGVNVQINIIAVERTYLRVIVDGEVAFEGRIIPGTAYPFEAGTQIEILAGNGAALRLIYNLRDMGLLGGYGEVVNLIYRADGVVTPTPTIGPTPTITPRITATPTPTLPSTPASIP